MKNNVKIILILIGLIGIIGGIVIDYYIWTLAHPNAPHWVYLFSN